MFRQIEWGDALSRAARLTKEFKEEQQHDAVDQSYQALINLLSQSEFSFTSFFKAVKSSPIIETLTLEYLFSNHFLEHSICAEASSGRRFFRALVNNGQLASKEKIRLLDFFFGILSTDKTITGRMPPHWGVFSADRDNHARHLLKTCGTKPEKDKVALFLEEHFPNDELILRACNCERLYEYLKESQILTEEQTQAFGEQKHQDPDGFLVQAAKILAAELKPNLDSLKYIYLYAHRNNVRLENESKIFQLLQAKSEIYSELWNKKKTLTWEPSKISFCMRWINALKVSQEIISACNLIRGHVLDETFTEYILKIAKQRLLYLDLTREKSHESSKLELLNSHDSRLLRWLSPIWPTTSMEIHGLISSNPAKAKRMFNEEQSELETKLLMRGVR